MDKVHLAVNGGLMRDLVLNQNLLDAVSELVREGKTSPKYRLWSVKEPPGLCIGKVELHEEELIFGIFGEC